jgi:hypothetical protein
MSGVMKPGRPMAATRMSACRVISPRFRVLEWQMVTVAFSWSRSSAAGLPTVSLRPTTTACWPAMGMPLRLRISMIPAGVQGANAGLPACRRPALDGMKAVHILGGRNGIQKRFGIDLLWQRQLDQDAVDVVAVVETCYQVEHVFGGDGVGRGDEVAEDAELGAGLHLAADVNLRCGVMAHQHSRQAGPNALGGQLLHFFSDFLLDGGGDCRAIENRWHHSLQRFMVSLRAGGGFFG